MQIPSGFNFENWTIITSGDGVCSLSGGVITATSGAASGYALAYKRIPVSPGDIIEFSCLGLKTNGYGDTAPQIDIDFPALTQSVNKMSLDGTGWQKQEVSFAVPLTATYGQHVCVVVGVPYDSGGSAQFSQPVININNSGYGSSRCVAMGLLQLNAGVPTLNNNAVQHGIKSLSYSSANKELSVFIRQFGDAIQSAPVVHATLDFASTRPQLNPKTSFIRSTGELKVRFYDGSTLVDVVSDALLLCNLSVSI